jgi:CspA family cold shock protein
MGRYKDYRERPSRGYDDDQTSNDRMEHRWPDQPTAHSTKLPEAKEAIVKWFNAEKGFGFVTVTNGSDAFLHIRRLEGSGHSSVPEGARLQVRLGEGQKGPEVTEVLGVDATAVQKQSPSDRHSPPPFSQQRRAEAPESQECLGIVRMYKTDKGFGFIGLDDGGKDAFVHASTLEQSGLNALKEGERVRVRIAQGQKGIEVRSISVLD